MIKIYVVFKNRTNTLKFYNITQKYKLNPLIISTPKEITSSCGLSVELDYNNLNSVYKILFKYGFNSFFGIYKRDLRNNIFVRLK